MTDKIVLNQLTVETTRRCNMRCPHCARGDAQNIDISLVDIDNVLDQVETIGRLIVTGGEPTLNLRALQYLADGIARRGIPLMRFLLITNGLIFDDRFVKIIQRFSEIIELTQRHGYGRDVKEPWRVQIGVSQDRYHSSPDTTLRNYLKLRRRLQRTAEVLKIRHGNAPWSVGRGETLEQSIDRRAVHSSFILQRVEMLSADHKPIGRCFESYRMARPDQKIVCCGLYLNVFGEMVPGVACDTEFDRPYGAIICNSEDNIWRGIEAHNEKCDRQNCMFCEDCRTKAKMLQERQNPERAQRELNLIASPDAQDELGAEPIYVGDIAKANRDALMWSIPDKYKELEVEAQKREYI